MYFCIPGKLKNLVTTQHFLIGTNSVIYFYRLKIQDVVLTRRIFLYYSISLLSSTETAVVLVLDLLSVKGKTNLSFQSSFACKK